MWANRCSTWAATSRLYRLLMDKDLEEHGVQLEAMNDTGNRIGDGVQDDFA